MFLSCSKASYSIVPTNLIHSLSAAKKEKKEKKEEQKSIVLRVFLVFRLFVADLLHCLLRMFSILPVDGFVTNPPASSLSSSILSFTLF